MGRDRQQFVLAVLALLIVLLAFGLRLWHVVAMDTPENPLRDPAVYDMDTQRIHQQALRILAEGPFPDQPFPHAPGYCYTVAAVYRVLGTGAYPVLYVMNALLGSLTALVVFLLGLRLFSPAVAVVAGFLAAVHGPLVFHTAFLLSDVQGALLSTLVLWQLMRVVDEPSLRGAALLGLILGASALTRPNTIMLSVAITLVLGLDPRIGSRARRFALLSVAGAITALLIAHSTWTASRGQGHLELICPTMHFNFVWANSVTSTGYGSAYPKEGTPLLDTFSVARLGHELRKASYIWRHFEFPCNTNYYLYGTLSPVVDLNPFTWRLVGPFALLGLALCLWARRAVPALLFVLWTWIPLNLTFVLGRLRLVMMPVLMLFAAHALVWLCARLLEPARRGDLARALAALVLLALFVNVQDPSYYHGIFFADSTFGNHQQMRCKDALRDAHAADARGDHDSARRLVTEAEQAARMLLRIDSLTYQILGWQILAEIRRLSQDTRGAQAAMERAADLRDKYDRLPPADHTGARFTPPTYRGWPWRWRPEPASLDWLDRELAKPRREH